MPYHLNAKGEPGLCKAVNKCPFGKADDHFTTPEAARTAFEKKNEDSLVITENWTPTDLKKALSQNKALQGRTLKDVRDNLKADFEDTLYYAAFDNEILIDTYAQRAQGFEGSEFSLDVWDDGTGPYVTISIDQTDYQEVPLRHIKELVDHSEDVHTDWGDTYTSHTWTIRLLPTDSSRAKAAITNGALKDSYKYLNKPEYPRWMVLPATRPAPSFIDSGATIVSRKANEAVKQAEAKVDAAVKAGANIQKHVKKLEVLAAEKAEVVKVLSSVNSPRVKKVLSSEVTLIDSESLKQAKIKAAAEKKSNPGNLKNLQTVLADAKQKQLESKEPLRKAAEDFAIKKIASHHPSPDGRRANSQARSWLKNHPELIDTILEEQRPSWS